MSQHFPVACTICGCVCDDIELTVEKNQIIRANRACFLAEPFFLSQNKTPRAAAEIDQKEVPLEEAISETVRLLKASQSPLIYGLSRSTTEGQRAAVALAEKIGATIDTTATTGHAQSLMALQRVGESTCSLGEVKHRADLVIYWASDPFSTHPRHWDRYAVTPQGDFIPNGRADRYVVVIDTEPSEASARADLFIQVALDQDWELLWILRGLIRGVLPAKEYPLSYDLAVLRTLAERMKTCRFGIVFFGSELTRRKHGARTVEALLQLTVELNQFTRFYARRMRRSGDVAGADSVLTWQTGYPFAVNFAQGFPRYQPGEFSAPEMLARREVDLCILLGSETITDFPESALDFLKEIPVITLDTPGQESIITPTIRFTTAVYGIHRPGTAYRMDEIPIPLRSVLETDYPSDAEILNQIHCQLVGSSAMIPVS